MKGKLVKPRDRRRIRVGSPTFEVEVRQLSSADWLDVQTRGIKLKSALRKQLSDITFIYALASDETVATKSVKRLARKLDLWCRQTRSLRQALWSDPINSDDQSRTVEEIVRDRFKLNPMWSWAPLIQLAQLLLGMEEIGRYYLSRLGDVRDIHTEPNVELWYVWVASLAVALREAEIDISPAPASDHVTDDFSRERRKLRREEENLRRERLSAFIYLVEKLHRTLPKRSVRRKRAADDDSKIQRLRHVGKQSLRKGVLDALRLAQKSTLDHLTTILVLWGIGATQYGRSVTAAKLIGFPMFDSTLPELRRQMLKRRERERKI